MYINDQNYNVSEKDGVITLTPKCNFAVGDSVVRNGKFNLAKTYGQKHLVKRLPLEGKVYVVRGFDYTTDNGLGVYLHGVKNKNRPDGTEVSFIVDGFDKCDFKSLCDTKNSNGAPEKRPQEE